MAETLSAATLNRDAGNALRGRSVLTLHDLSDDELVYLLESAALLKQKKNAGVHGNLLQQKNIAMVFEKMSTRTRCAVAVAVADEGGRTEYLSSREIHLGKKESVADTARVLGRMFHGIVFRGYLHTTVEMLALHAGIPVWNGLTDRVHPTQAMADLLTVKEAFGKLKGLRLVYMGDGRNNVANSLMAGCAKMGLDFINCTPPELQPDAALMERAGEAARRNGASLTVIHDPMKAVEGANVVCTDVWASMGEESRFEERVRLLRPYQVNAELMEATGNLESGNVIFLHCLPAFHDNNTDVTRELGALEVTDDVFEAPYSKVFDEAENRVHTIKALLVASLSEVG